MRLPGLRLFASALAALIAGCGGATAEPPPELRVERALDGRVFEAPVELGAYPGGRLFVAQQDGQVFLTDAHGTEHGLLLDLRERVGLAPGEGLLSVALDPAFSEHGALWAYYFASEPPRTVLSRFTVASDAAGETERARADSELVVLEIEQPGYNQNGGAIRFGPDGMLYLSVGDGSASVDPFDQGQDASTLLATVLRIDVRTASAEQPYVVPGDNPFVDASGARPELWAYGLRNPWRMAFDPLTGDLWLGDVGSTQREQIERVERGANHGWSVFEGRACIARPAECAALEDSTFPVAEYEHLSGRCAAVGGVVYRGDAIASLDGIYLFADLCTGEIFALDTELPGEPVIVARAGGSPVSFAIGADDELYVVDYTGPIWRLVTR